MREVGARLAERPGRASRAFLGGATRPANGMLDAFPWCQRFSTQLLRVRPGELSLGVDIDRIQFEKADHERFRAQLRSGLVALEELLARPGFGAGAPSIGAELELNLIGADAQPLLLNEAVLAETHDPRLTLEINRYNLEINSTHVPLALASFTALEQDLDDALERVRRTARSLGGRVVTIGILPTLGMRDIASDALSDRLRYRALSNRLRELRGGRPFPVRIQGEELLSFEADDVTLEGANTSFQMHLRTEPRDFARLYNAAQLATGIALAIGGNSPTFLGKRLWEETRIALFRQSVDDRFDSTEDDWRPARVSFGHGWVRRGAFEIFEEGVAMHSTLMPIVTTEDSIACVRAGGLPRLAELRLHAGTVWRWNRPVYDDAEGGHLRIELRALPAGPTVVDAIATSAFMIGLTLGMAETADRWIHWITFGQARRNFYQAARHGLDAELSWPTECAPSEPRVASELVFSLIPIAARGLREAGVDEHDISRLLGIVETRAATRITGARWQRLALDRFASSPRPEAAMVTLYDTLSVEGQPVHTWPLP